MQQRTERVRATFHSTVGTDYLLICSDVCTIVTFGYASAVETLENGYTLVRVVYVQFCADVRTKTRQCDIEHLTGQRSQRITQSKLLPYCLAVVVKFVYMYTRKRVLLCRLSGVTVNVVQ